MKKVYLNKRNGFTKFRLKLVMLVIFQINLLGNINFENRYSFIFENDDIQLTLSINKLTLEKQDSLSFDLVIVNKTKDTVLVFPDIEITYTKNKEERRLFIEHGGRFSPGLEGLEKMIMILPYSDFTLKSVLHTEFLISNGFSGFFPIIYSFAYVPNLKTIYNNEHLSILKHTMKAERGIEISNMVIFASLKIEMFEAFYCKLK